jgi:hypothetical protein
MEAMKARELQNAPSCTGSCMETIVVLEKEIKFYQVDLAKQYKINTNLSEALKAIRENTHKEVKKALS